MSLKVPLPPNVKILVKVGEEVDFKTPLYQKSVRRDVRIPLAKVLEVKPEKIFYFLKKAVGEEIHKGEVLAIKKSLLSKRKIYSEYDGILKEVSHQDGTIVISAQTDKDFSALSYFKGQVESIEKDHLKIKVKKAEEYDLAESNKSFGGEVYYVTVDDINLLKQEEIDSKILIIKKIESFNQVRLEVMGGHGFVTFEKLAQNPSVNYARIKNAKDWDYLIKTKLPYCLVTGDNIYFYQ